MQQKEEEQPVSVSVNIRIFGACLATPSRPAGGTVPQLSVLTPCCPRSRIATDNKTQIDALYTYLVVDADNFNASKSTRRPDFIFDNKKVVAFLLHREEISVSNDAGTGVALGSDGTTLPGAPGSQSRDVRWIPSLSELLPKARVNPKCVKDADPPAVLCTRFVFQSGRFDGGFPCGNAKKRKMKNTTYENYLAQEMNVSLDTDGTLTLECTPFATNLKKSYITLEAPGGIPFHVFLATGPLINLFELADFNPCATNNDHSGHADDDADYEFETLWDLFVGIPSGALLPVPEIKREHGPRADCVPGGA